MKKTLFTLFFAIASLATFAQINQNDYPTITFGIMGGANEAFLNTKMSSGSSISNNPISVGSFGINADFRFSDYLSVRPGIFYSGKGGDIQYQESFIVPGPNGLGGSISENIDQKFTLNYLEIPVTLIGHLPVSDSFNILVGAGPYVAMGLNGKTTTTPGGGDTETDNAKFGNDGDFKSTDFGATALLGFETQSGIIVGINYDIGLTNILQSASAGGSLQSLKTGAIYVSLGFAFR
jgi:hypothetical protein